MFKEITNKEYEAYFEEEIGLFNACLYMKDIASGKEVKSILKNKDMEFITISLLENKGKVFVNEESFLRFFTFVPYSNIEDTLNQFSNDVFVCINKIYKYNITNKNYFWNEIQNISKKVKLVFDLSKDSRSLYYKWNKLTPREQEEFIKLTARSFSKKGLFNKFDCCIYTNKIDMITQLRNYPEIVVPELKYSNIIGDSTDSIQKDLLVKITEDIIQKML